MQNIRKNAHPVLEVLEARLNPASIALLDQVSLMYRVGLDRLPDPQGLAYYSTQLENGVSPVNVARQILFSPEHNQKMITGYYSQILNREPDAAGLAAWETRINGFPGGVSGQDHKKWIDVLSLSWGSGRGISTIREESLAAAFLASPEKSGTLTNAAYMDMLYRTVLGRSPDTQGLKNWLNKLSSGTSRQAVAQAILESREASTYAVDGMYVSILGRQPSTAEKQGWIQALQDPFVTYADVAAAFLDSAEARARLAGNDNPLMTVVEPSTTFWQKNISFATQGNHGVTATAPLKLNPVVQLSHFGQDIAFTETAFGISSIPITSGGSGYTSAPRVTISGPKLGGGIAAKATATIQNGVITKYTFNPNSGAQAGPYTADNTSITVSPPSNQNGTNATFSFHLNNGYIDYVTLTNGGSGYDANNPPKVTIKLTANTPPDFQTATIAINSTDIADGVVTAITIDNPGQGYAPNETVPVTIGNAPVPANSAVVGSVVAGAVEVPSRAKFKAWASDYLSFVANTGVSTAIINIGDWKADKKGLYNYLNPALGDTYGTTQVPWIVTDFLEPLGKLQKPDGSPADIQVGACAYLKDAWHLYGNETPDGSEDPANVNFEGNVYITDGKAGSPPKNNIYQAFELINDINQVASTKFITYFEFDGEGGGSFVPDTNYGFNGAATLPPKTPGGQSWQYSETTDPTIPGEGNWPTTGTGYTKWLWNHFMPGVAQADLAPGGAMPGSAPGIPAPTAGIPDVVWTDAQAVDPLTWSQGKYGNAVPYQFGSISYRQNAWHINSLGPVRAYSENYWWGENNYMPGAPSAISAAGQNSSVPFQIPVTDDTVYNGQTTVTFNTPTIIRADGSTITGTPAAGYAVIAKGSVDLVTPGNNPVDPSGLIPANPGFGYSTGIWISEFPKTSGGYKKGDTIQFLSDNGGQTASGNLDVDNNGNLTGVTITNPGQGWTAEPTRYTINNQQDNLPVDQKASFQAWLMPEHGYPTLTFDNSPQSDGTATGYALVTSQTYKPGSITSIVINDPGKGYLKTANTTLDGQSTAQLVANIANGEVVSVSVLNGGAGYTSPPVITFSNPNQLIPTRTAVAVAVLDGNGKVKAVNVTDGGSGYYPNSKSDGIPPVAASVPTGGNLSGVKMAISATPAPSDILSQYGKTSGTTSFTPAGIGLESGEYGFYLQVSRSANTADHIVVTRLGDHYSAAGKASLPFFTISDGSNSSPNLPVPINTLTYNKAYAPIFDLSGAYILNGNGLSLVNVLDGGAGYSAGVVLNAPGKYGLAPTVAFSPPSGGGLPAKGFVVWDKNSGQVTGVQVTNPGSGYTAEPTITFIQDPGDTSQVTSAAATAYVMNYPVVTIGPGMKGFSPAAAYALVGPVDKDNPDPNAGYVVNGIAFTDYGSGYIPQGSKHGQPPTLTPAIIASLPTMTVSAPNGGRAAVVDGQFAIASKWNAFWLDGSGSITSQVGPASSATLESVGSVTVNSPGSGYGWDAQVTFSSPPAGGETAVGYVVLNPDSSVNRIAITNPGSGYTSPPTATVSSPSNTGSGASLSVNSLIPKIRGGGNVYNYTIWDGSPSDLVTSIDFVPIQDDGSHTTGGNVYQNGSGYKMNDTVVFTRNPADQPAPVGQTYVDAVAVVSQVDSTGAILAFSITNGGSGYQAAPSAMIQSATGTGAAIQPSLQNLILSANAADAVYAHYAAYPEALAQMFNDPLYTAEPSLPKLGSSYYQKLDLQQDNAQSGQTGVPNNSNGIGQGGIATFSLESVLLSNTGSQAVALGAVQVANAVATVQNGVVTKVALAQNDNGGANYTYPPQVVFGGPGTGAAATAIIQGGKVTGFTVTSGGSGYSTAPTVTLDSGCLDSKYHSTVELNDVNGLGGTFGGLSMLTYNDFITFLNNAADIIVGSQKSIASTVPASGYSFNPSSPGTLLFNGTIPDSANIRVGMTVEGAGIQVGTTVQSIPKATATAVNNPSNGNWTINITDGATGYTIPPNVVITGDGTGATATATVDPTSGKVSAISLTYSSTATPYTWMNVSIQQSQQIVLSKPLTATPGALTFYNPISASDVTFSIYDSAFLPLSWLDGQVTNGWKEANTAPKFSGLLTAGTVAPTALAGTVIYTALATDNDLLAANKRITYDLKRGLDDDATLLRINPSTGQVMLRYAASQFPRQSYTFTVVAMDGGGLSVEKTVTVPVVYT